MRELSRRELLGVAVAPLGWAGLATAAAAAERGPCPLAGTWTYRSFLNDPDPSKPFNDLQFAVAELTFQEADFGVISGRLSFGDDYLKLAGTLTYGNPFAARFQGVGATAGTIEDGHPWVYDYLGFVAPAWPSGTADNPPAIVGTIVRTVAHSQGQAKAGFVASFIALRRAVSKAK
jgi:hypothetical protein